MTSLPPIPHAVALAYRDLMTVARELTGLMIIAAIIAAVARLPLAMLEPANAASSSRFVLIAFVSDLTQVFLLTPFFIAIHRLIILGETVSGYALTAGERRFQLYFTAWAALSVLDTVPMFVLGAGATSAARFLALVWMIVVMIVGLRLTTLFPAIAVDGASASIRRAFAETRRHAWRILVIGVMAFLPLILVRMLARRLVEVTCGSAAICRVLVDCIDGVVYAAMITLFLAIASRFYLWIGDKAKQVE